MKDTLILFNTRVLILKFNNSQERIKIYFDNNGVSFASGKIS